MQKAVFSGVFFLLMEHRKRNDSKEPAFFQALLLEPAIKLLRGRLADDLKGAEGMKENDDGGGVWAWLKWLVCVATFWFGLWLVCRVCGGVFFKNFVGFLETGFFFLMDLEE